MSETRIGSETVPTGFGVGRRVHLHDSGAPAAAVVTPSVLVAVRDAQSRPVLVRRRDSGAWEVPGGRLDVGGSVLDAAVRETL